MRHVKKYYIIKCGHSKEFCMKRITMSTQPLILFQTVGTQHGRSQPKIKGGANFLKLIYSAVFNDGKKLEG